MKIYAVVEGYSYEGYSTPKSAFSTVEAAKEHAAELRKERWPADFIDVIEIVVDDPRVKPREVASL